MEHIYRQKFGTGLQLLYWKVCLLSAIPGAGSGARCIVFAVRRRPAFVGFMSRLGYL